LPYNSVAKQVARELHSVTGGVSQCFSMRNVEHSVAQSRIQVYFLQHIAATCSAIAQCFTPPENSMLLSIDVQKALQGCTPKRGWGENLHKFVNEVLLWCAHPQSFLDIYGKEHK